MGKPTRSPLLGYNHNVRYGGRILHVQTEDSGPANPHLFTHLFFEGSILATKRCQYDAEVPEDGVRALMQGQHKEILKELKKGAYNDRLEEFFAARGEMFNAPDTASPVEAQPAPASPPISDEAAPMLQSDVTEPDMPLPDVTPAPVPEVLDLDAIPTPPPEHLQTPETVPLHIVHGNPSGPGAYNFRRPTRDITSVGPSEPGAPPERRRFPRPPPVPTPASPVVVQRRVVVGAANKTPGPMRPMAPRPRRPGGGIPYVVQEGSHPNLVAGRHPTRGVPPARPMAEPIDADAAPRTAAAPPPVPQEPESLVSSRSLDDVILAYLSKGDQRR